MSEIPQNPNHRPARRSYHERTQGLHRPTTLRQAIRETVGELASTRKRMLAIAAIGIAGIGGAVGQHILLNHQLPDVKPAQVIDLNDPTIPGHDVLGGSTTTTTSTK